MEVGIVEVAAALGAIVILQVVLAVWQRSHVRSATAAEAEAAEVRMHLEQASAALALERDRLARMTSDYENAAQSLEIQMARTNELDRELAAKSGQLKANLDVQVQMQQNAAALKQDHDRLAVEVSQLRADLAKTSETLAQERRQSHEKLALLDQAREALTNQFKALANDIVRGHSETFAKQNKEQVESLLNPMRERLLEFQNNLQTAHAESLKERTTLQEQIRNLTERSAQMSAETVNLTRALKSRPQSRGAWGEMVLGTILERSGLREGEEYVAQESFTNEEGDRVRPDVVVNLPGGQKVVIDSKLSLVAFEEHVNADDDVARMAAAKRHVAAMRAHVKGLAAKSYSGAAQSSLDYVIMFVPIEGALSLALEEDPSLTADAATANVAIATPTTLMMALRTVWSVWQVERRNRNAEEIADRAGKLYDKFVGFTEDMEKLEKQLDNARSAYDSAMGKLRMGPGNLVRQVEMLKELGAKTQKSIPARTLEDSEAGVMLVPLERANG